TRGIGFGLAEAFLARGVDVVVSGRSAAAVDDAVARLAARGLQGRALGVACDVTDPAALEALWAAAIAGFGEVTTWINNAGACNAIRPFAEVTPAEIVAVVDVNLRGAMLG